MRDRGLAADRSCHQPFFSASRDHGDPWDVHELQLVFQWRAAAFACRPAPGRRPRFAPATRSGSRVLEQYEDRKRARTEGNRLGRAGDGRN